MMTSAQVVETSVNVTSNSPSQDYSHPDDHNLPNYDMTPGFKPFTAVILSLDIEYQNVDLWGLWGGGGLGGANAHPAPLLVTGLIFRSLLQSGIKVNSAAEFFSYN